MTCLNYCMKCSKIQKWNFVYEIWHLIQGKHPFAQVNIPLAHRRLLANIVCYIVIILLRIFLGICKGCGG